MASSEWKIQDKMPRRTLRGPAFRALPESIEMTYDINQQLSEAEESEEEESEEEEESGDEESGDEESKEEESGDEESGDEESKEEESGDEESEAEESGDEENFELKFDTDRHRFMEKFSDISSRRDSTEVVWCLSQHYELNYATYPNLYFLQLSAPIEELKKRNNSVNVISCSCAYFEKSNSPCKHMLLFDILYTDFRASVRRSTRDRRAPDRLRY